MTGGDVSYSELVQDLTPQPGPGLEFGYIIITLFIYSSTFQKQRYLAKKTTVN